MSFLAKLTTVCIMLQFTLVSSISSAILIPVFIGELFSNGVSTSMYPILNKTSQAVPLIDYNELAPNGQRQTYMLGKQVAMKSYPSMFSQLSSTSGYQMFSIGNKKCLNTAQSHLIGLYENKGGNVTSVPANLLNPPLSGFSIDQPTYPSALPNKILPVAIHSSIPKEDTLFFSEDALQCPDLRNRWRLVYQKNLDDDKVHKAWESDIKSVQDTMRAS